jgi:hypothetical protein
MKMNISKLYMFLMAAFAMVACDPNKDIIKELEENPAPITADLDIVLVADDYEDSGNDGAAKFGNFSSEDDAKEGIPNILTAQYPHLGQGSSAKVQYDLYAPIRMSYDTIHTLTSEDYDAIGESYGNLSSLSDIFKATSYIVPDPQGNEVLVLGYEWWNGSGVETREDKMAYYEGDWYISYVPTTEEYYAMGQSFPNFDSRSTARREIEGMLNTNYYLSAEEGDFRTSVFTYTYKNDDGVRQFDNFLAVFMFVGGKWAAIQDVSPRVLQLGHDGSKWVPDNTIKYTMTGDDYAFVVTEYESVNPAGAASMDRFGNYDITIWSAEEIESSIADVLMEHFASSPDGQKYLVFYKVWTGSASDEYTLHMIKSGDTYVPVEG